MPEQPAATHSMENANAELERLQAENAILRAQAEELRARVSEVDARLAKDTHNSNKSPSSNSPFKKPPPRAQRKPSGRKPGGQKGHRGSTLELVEDPDEQTIVPLMGVCDCGRCCGEIAAEFLPERRQVIEVEIRRQVVEYCTVAGTCACGRTHRIAFPEAVSALAQYGASVSALAVYLTQFQLLPDPRTAELFEQLAGITLSVGTPYRAVEVAGYRLKLSVQAIREALIGAPVAHADKTGMRVGTDLYWLHVLAARRNRQPTSLMPNKAARHWMTSACWRRSPASSYTATGRPTSATTVCTPSATPTAPAGAAITIAETIPIRRRWTEDMITLPCEANIDTAAARRQGLAVLPAPQVERPLGRYDAILAAAEQRIPPRPPPGSRCRVKQSPAYKLIKRLRDKRSDVLRFITDLRVPFDNNQAERDLRMPKAKQKISGGFRTDTRIEFFAIIRSCPSLPCTSSPPTSSRRSSSLSKVVCQRRSWGS